MNCRIEYLRDVVGNNYLGVNVYTSIVDPFLNRLKNIIGDNYDSYIKNQKDRDHGHYHITVINVMDYNKICNKLGMDKFINSLESVFNYEIDDVKLLGIGTAEKAGNRTYFIVAQSDKLQEIRKKYELPEHDFHITIGFLYKDVFGVRKNEVIKEVDPFLKELKKRYYDSNETFEFIKGIPNFDGDKLKEIEPIKITDTLFTFKCGEFEYFTISLLDPDGIRVTAKWQNNEKIPIIPTTLILKKFKEV